MYSTPFFIKEFKKRNILVVDMYKASKSEIPTQGATIIILSLFLISAFLPIISRILNRIFSSNSYSDLSLQPLDVSILFIISLFAFYGLFDDIVDIGWYPKIFLPVVFSFPLIPHLEPTSLVIPVITDLDLNLELFNSFIGPIFLSDIFKVIIIPIYIMVCSNLQNMHSGFNGLQSGLFVILLSTVLFKCFLDSNEENLVTFYILLGSAAAFWFFNKYPAQIIEGNIGSLSFGASIGALICIKEYYLFGIFILIPHIIDFFFLIFLKSTGRPFIKFGEINSEGNIAAPNPYKLKFLLPFFFKLNESQTVYYLYILTAVFCITGIIIF